MAGEIGYVSIDEADAYFAARLYSKVWTDIVTASGDPIKTAALTTAFDRLWYCGLFSLPTFAAATVDQLAILKKAQCELSLYLLIHLADEDRRLGLQAQGVTAAGIVKETYGGDPAGLPIPPFVVKMLEEYAAPVEAGFYVVDIGRDENESVDTDVTDF